jgi:ligand-binding sensor domain-containing protein
MLILTMIGRSPSYGRDKSDWTTYTAMNWVQDLLLDSDDVWAASEGGVYRYDLKDSTYTTYTNLNGLAGNYVLCIERDASGNLWFGTDGDGLSKWVEGSGIVATYPDFAGDRINALCAYGDKLFVATAKNGISVFLPEREEIKESYRMLGRLPKDVEVLSVEVIGDLLWAGTVEGVAFADLSQPNLLDPASWNSIRVLHWDVRAIAHDDCAVYVGTKWGVAQWKDEKWRVGGRFMGQVYDLTMHGTEVLAATEKGLFRKHEETWERDAWFLDEIPVFVLRSASPDVLWLHAQDIGLTYLRGPHRAHVPPPLGPPRNKFMDLQVDPSGVLWAATSLRQEENNGIYRFDGKVWSQYRWSGENSNKVVAVEVDRKGRIWAGTWGGGGFLIEDDGTANTASDLIYELTPDNTPLHPTVSGGFVVVNDFTIDIWGNIWMCNYHGNESPPEFLVTPLVVMDDFPAFRQQYFTTSDDRLPTGELNVITADPAGLIWFGTRELGFGFLDVGGTPFDKSDDHIVTFSTASYPDTLTSNNVSDIVVDQEGVLWVATDNGVNAIRGAYSRTEGTFLVESWDRYGREEGLGSAIVHVIVEDAAGNKWFGTEAGLARLSARDGSILLYTRANSGLVDDGVRSLAFNDRTGELWIGTTWGLSKLKVSSSAPTPALPEIRVFPNPMILSHENAEITFADLPDDTSTVRIFTLSGELVCVRSPESGAGSVTWDGGNEFRNMVGSGVYFYVVTDSMGRHITGKFAVVR